MIMSWFTSIQVCSATKCPYGSLIDTNNCKCITNYDSTCQSGFKPVKYHNLCTCEQKTKPRCPSRFYLNSACTLCSIHATPTCPSGSTLTDKTVKCTGTAMPKCPTGTTRKGCECVKKYVRKCSSGGTLSWDGCKCTGGSTKPTCSYGCHLNWSNCRCVNYHLEGKNNTCGNRSTQTVFLHVWVDQGTAHISQSRSSAWLRKLVQEKTTD